MRGSDYFWLVVCGLLARFIFGMLGDRPLEATDYFTLFGCFLVVVLALRLARRITSPEFLAELAELRRQKEDRGARRKDFPDD
jgi:hypothetical protein